jgi:hypothetical protein
MSVRDREMGEHSLQACVFVCVRERGVCSKCRHACVLSCFVVAGLV